MRRFVRSPSADARSCQPTGSIMPPTFRSLASRRSCNDERVGLTCTTRQGIENLAQQRSGGRLRVYEDEGVFDRAARFAPDGELQLFPSLDELRVLGDAFLRLFFQFPTGRGRSGRRHQASEPRTIRDHSSKEPRWVAGPPAYQPWRRPSGLLAPPRAVPLDADERAASRSDSGSHLEGEASRCCIAGECAGSGAPCWGPG